MNRLATAVRPTPTAHVDPRVGIIAFAAFCLVIAGPNLPNPLVPDYARIFDLDPLGQGALFSAYLFALVASLVVTILRPARPTNLPLVLTVSVALSIVADAAMIAGGSDLPLLYAARLVSGVSVGIGTGAASAIVLAALGVRSRTLIGSGVILGALLGNLGAGALGTFLMPATVSSYLVHGVLGIGAVVALLSIRENARSLLEAAETPPRGVRIDGPLQVRHRLAGYVLGTLSWLAAGVVIALLPTAVRADQETTLLAAVIPGCVFLAAAYLAQQLSRPHLRTMRAWHLVLPLAATFVLLATALESGSYAAMIAAALVAGAAQGPAYTLGLATVTYGLSPARQAAVSSRYAAISYSGCAIGVLLVGSVASTPAGVPGALYATAAVCAIFGLGAVIAAGSRQDLRAVS